MYIQAKKIKNKGLLLNVSAGVVVDGDLLEFGAK